MKLELTGTNSRYLSYQIPIGLAHFIEILKLYRKYDEYSLIVVVIYKPGTVGGTRCSGVYISSFSCLTYTTIRESEEGKIFRRFDSDSSIPFCFNSDWAGEEMKGDAW